MIKKQTLAECSAGVCFFHLLALKGEAIGALIDTGIHLVRADLDLVEAAKVAVVAVICALAHRTFDAAVELMTIHISDLLD